MWAMVRIVLKTIDELIFRSGAEYSLKEILKEYKILANGKYQVKNLFSTLNKISLEKLSSRAAALDAIYQPVNFSNYHLLECDEADTIELLQKLRDNDHINWAYLDDNYSVGPNIDPDRKSMACYQGYLRNAPEGIGVSHAWKRKGGRGDSSIKFVDIEQGWLFNHESLNLQRIPHTGINYIPASDHGAGVMGIIMMRDGGSGGIGITPLVNGSVMSLYRPNGIFNTPDAIVSALQFLDPGDILLLECQALDPDNEFHLWPIEIRHANFDVIRLATALGITVIEPSGNGNINSSTGNCLDKYMNTSGQMVLDRHHSDFKDSGAIMVAAAYSDVPHHKIYYTNFGNRIDCYAWGENILTAGLHPKSSGMANNTYTHQFGGTSGAAAILAGVAIALQSMMEANHQCRLYPKQLREVLGSLCYGTESGLGTDVDRIGVMPDLEKITRDYVDKFECRETIIPLKQYDIEMPSIYEKAV